MSATTKQKNELIHQDDNPFWSTKAADQFKSLGTSETGLSAQEAARRLEQYGPNSLRPKKRTNTLTLFLSQFKSPITIILLIAVIISVALGEPVDAIIITAIILLSGILGFWQEHGAAGAIEKLLAIVQVTVPVLRGGADKDVLVEEVVPGDIFELSAGAVVPGDSLLIESKDLFINEATLTGETYPVDKETGVLATDTPLAKRNNSLFMGTHVVSGTGKAVVVRTGKATEFGKVSQRLELRHSETDFERGVRRFGYLLMEITLILVIAIFAINSYHAVNKAATANAVNTLIINALLFSLALAVGLTPQLLPAIISVNLAHGAKRMAQKKVIVKRLVTIENFGSMNVLCSDKTGTLTEGAVEVKAGLDAEGNTSAKVLNYAFFNSKFVSGVPNIIDEALRKSCSSIDCSMYEKLDEVPYDFIRKRLSILIEKDDQALMITKGALDNILEVCTKAETASGLVDLSSVHDKIQADFLRISNEGSRVLGVACIDPYPGKKITKDSEKGMTFLGFIVFFDPPKANIQKTVAELCDLGVSLKMITGDNKLVAAYVATQVGLPNPTVLTGKDLLHMTNEALTTTVNRVNVFAEVEPNQKERIILMLKRAGNVVGYMGDGINDASALHAADVGISVNTAVDVAKDAADIVLLEQDLAVLAEGVKEGRVTFANTMKYVFMATSANFGNMFSMAGASMFLGFLPLLPKQILLTNVMTDVPEMTIASDSVDQELIDRPERWDIHFIRNFMMVFGFLSSVFDFITFGVLLLVLGANEGQFQTGWFMESIISACLIVLVIRTRKPFIHSHPGKGLLMATLSIVIVTLILPFTPLGPLFGFVSPPLVFIVVMLGIVGLYILFAELTKYLFYKATRNRVPEKVIPSSV